MTTTVPSISRGLSGVAALLLTPVLWGWVPSWVVIVLSCSAVIQISQALKPMTSPTVHHPRVTQLLALLCIIALIYTGLGQSHLTNMVSLLTSGTALTLLSLDSRRHQSQLTLAGLFLCASAMVNHSSGIPMLLILSSLLALFSSSMAAYRLTNLTQAITSTLTLMGQALPIAAILFLIMPRLPPLWTMPTASSAQTGLSDTINPGAIANLTRSDDLAFRAEFKGTPPPQASLYWRAIVLEDFDGQRWSERRTYSDRSDAIHRQAAALKEYEIYAQPTSEPWLYSLRGSSSRSPSVLSNAHDVLRQDGASSQTFTYQAQQYPLKATMLDAHSRQLNTMLPTEGNPRLRQWAQRRLGEAQTEQDFIRGLAQHLSQSSFRYTLQPQAWQDNGMDQFWFEQQAGFCSHYASTTAFILRSVGIPARLVTGYQGGDQQQNGYFNVYQYDAHAWVEYWLDGYWQRFDPTAFVSPERIQLGMLEALSAETEFLSDTPLSLHRFSQYPGVVQLRAWLSDVDHLWDRWVVNFDGQQRRDLLAQWLGELTITKVALFGIGGVLMIGLLLLAYFFPWARLKIEHNANRYYQSGQDILTQYKLARPKAMTPWEYHHWLAFCLPPRACRAWRLLTILFLGATYHERRFPHQRARRLLRIIKNDLKQHGVSDMSPLPDHDKGA